MNNNVSNTDKLVYYLILIGIFLKCTALIPTIFNVYYTQNATAINYLTIIFFFIAFLTLAIISLIKGFYSQFAIFLIGLTSTIVLFFMKLSLENGFSMEIKANQQYFNDEINYEKAVDTYEKTIKKDEKEIKENKQ